MYGFNFYFFPKKGQLYSLMHQPPDADFQAYFEEGIDGVIMTYRNQEHITNYIDGQRHGGRPGYGFYNQVIEAVSFAPRVEEVLVIGYGTGSSTETILKLPDVKKATLVELNRTLMQNLNKMTLFQDIFSDPRLEIVFDDGRRFLSRHQGKFDLVLMSPVRTKTAYSNNLYSKQFFELVSNHLKPDGVVMV